MSDCSSSGSDEDLDPELELLDELGETLSKVNTRVTLLWNNTLSHRFFSRGTVFGLGFVEINVSELLSFAYIYLKRHNLL